MGKDLSDEIASALTLHGALEEAAAAHSQDIGTADYCCEQIGAKLSPGKLITWCLNTDVVKLYEIAEDLWKMVTPLDSVIGSGEGPAPFRKLFDGENGAVKGQEEAGWGGESGDAFEERYTSVFHPNAKNVKAAIDTQAHDIYKLGEAFQKLGQACLDALNDNDQLGDFYNQYVKAVEKDVMDEIGEDLAMVGTEVLKFGGNAGQSVVKGEPASSAISSGVTMIATLLGRFGNNVADVANDVVAPAMATVEKSASATENGTSGFSVIPKSDFKPISNDNKDLTGDWESD